MLARPVCLHPILHRGVFTKPDDPELMILAPIVLYPEKARPGAPGFFACVREIDHPNGVAGLWSGCMCRVRSPVSHDHGLRFPAVHVSVPVRAATDAGDHVRT